MAEKTRVEELERLLQEAKLRAEAAEQQIQQERQRVRQEQERVRQEQQRADVAEQQTQHTTLDEYISACHSLVFSGLTIEDDPKLTSKGPITNPRNKWCPTTLQPWSDFLQEQRVTFGAVYSTFPAESRLFENRSFLAGLGNRISKRKIADEKALEYFLHNSVEDPVKTIIDQLKQAEATKLAFRLGNGIIFDNHPHAISEVADEVVDHDTTPSTPDHRLNLNQLRPDQICVYQSDEVDPTRRTMIYISEYKPPHKLTAPHLRLGLRPMNIYKDVVNRKTIPTSVDPAARFQYHAERLTAAAITQTYHYMIEGGLDYGLLTTGEAIVFLKIDWREPGTLLYHLAEPKAEVNAHASYSHLCTAVGQYLAFSLLALGPPDGRRRVHGQEERRRATESLTTWAEDFETTLRSIPPDERNAPASSPGYEPETYEGVDRSPYLFRHKRRVDDDPPTEQASRDSEESSDDDPGPALPDTPSPTERRTRRGGSAGQRGQAARRSQRSLPQRPRGGRGTGREEQDVLYCTQKCLLGLVNGGLLDPECPNVARHRRQPNSHQANCRGSSRTDTRHLISHAKFLSLLWEQLKRSLDDGLTPLGQGGARGVLFKVRLLAYGYTFVSKGTVKAFVKDLEHEAAVYARLQPIQGSHVPVFLGAIDLRSMNKIYYYDHRVYIIHLTFLSWGGNDLKATDIVGDAAHLESQAIRSLRAIHMRGVIHKDVRAGNMLFNDDINAVMMIDFERALLLDPPRRPLAQVVPNKRRCEPETSGSSKPAKESSRRSERSRAFSDDIGMVKLVFSDCMY